MHIGMNWHKAAAIAGTLAATMLLSGCLLAPGKFTASLDLRKGGGFTYRYDGEIHLLAMSKLAEMGEAAEDEEAFVEQPCYEEGDEFKERDCTAEEKADQRKTWDEAAEARKAEREKDSEAMRAMLGGIDPADPEAAQELAAKIRRQRGWARVDYKGDGLYDVSFRLDSRSTHDFLFPTFEGFPLSNLFVAVTRRGDGTVRIDAPGFAQRASGSPFQGMMAGMAGAMAAAKDGDKSPKGLPPIEGTFEIVTDGEILANNTDEGPKAGEGGKTVRWTINQRTNAPPMALIRVE